MLIDYKSNTNPIKRLPLFLLYDLQHNIVSIRQYTSFQVVDIFFIMPPVYILL